VSVPVLRGLGADGKVLWSHRLPSGPQSTMVMGLAATADQAALALVSPTVGRETETDYSVIRVDRAGTEVARLAISLAGDGRARHSGYVGVDGTAALAVINVGERPKSGNDRFALNGLGLLEQCWEGDAANIIFIDLAGLIERKRGRIERFEARGALATDDGWIVVGDARDDCGLARHAAAYTVGNDGSVGLLWRDASPFNTFGRGIRKSEGVIEIIGYAQRSIAIQEEAPAGKAPDFSAKRLGNEAYVSGEVFSVRLSEQGAEQRRDFVGAGFPVIPNGITSTGERRAIFGTVGSRPLWMAH
jgi:hypothetical protein